MVRPRGVRHSPALRRFMAQNKPAPRPREPSPFFPLLELPDDIVSYIASFLSQADQICLTATCRALHRVLPMTGEARSSFPGWEKHMACYKISNSSLSHRYCRSCRDFHEVSLTDTPAHPETIEECLASVPECQEVYTPLKSYQLRHQHIIQALKYWAFQQKEGYQLSTSQSRHLDALLAPYHTFVFISQRCFRDFWSLYNFSSSGTGVVWLHSVYPKIVSGRFLLRSVWLGLGTRPEGATEYRRLCICKHQFCYPASKFRGRPPGIVEPPPSRSYASLADISDTGDRLPLEDVRYWLTRLARAERVALLEDRGTEIPGSCPFCPTDFAVQHLVPGKIAYCSWQDLGSVDSTEYDSERRSMDWSRLQVEGSWHAAGSVRELYDSVPGDGPGGNSTSVEDIVSDMARFGPNLQERMEAFHIPKRWREARAVASYRPQRRRLRPWAARMDWDGMGYRWTAWAGEWSAEFAVDYWLGHVDGSLTTSLQFGAFPVIDSANDESYTGFRIGSHRYQLLERADYNIPTEWFTGNPFP